MVQPIGSVIDTLTVSSTARMNCNSAGMVFKGPGGGAITSSDVVASAVPLTLMETVNVPATAAKEAIKVT